MENLLKNEIDKWLLYSQKNPNLWVRIMLATISIFWTIAYSIYTFQDYEWITFIISLWSITPSVLIIIHLFTYKDFITYPFSSLGLILLQASILIRQHFIEISFWFAAFIFPFLSLILIAVYELILQLILQRMHPERYKKNLREKSYFLFIVTLVVSIFVIIKALMNREFFMENQTLKIMFIACIIILLLSIINIIRSYKRNSDKKLKDQV